MNDHAGEWVGGRGPVQRITLPMSDAARASLLAVQAAQEAARARARRETRRTRAWVLGLVGIFAVGVFLLGPRKRAHQQPASSAAANSKVPAVVSGLSGTAAVAPASSSQISAVPTTTMAAALPAALTGSLPTEASPITASTTPIVKAAASAGAGAGAGPGAATAAELTCAETFGQHRWRLSIDACVEAFRARPTDAGLALRIAQAHHARARLPEAEEWARRALGLDPTLAEGFVIVAHAESHAGHPEAAVEAYRHYLGLAPRGWHASEARAAVRERTRAAARAHAQLRGLRRQEDAGSQPASASLPPSPADAEGAAPATVSVSASAGAVSAPPASASAAATATATVSTPTTANN